MRNKLRSVIAFALVALMIMIGCVTRVEAGDAPINTTETYHLIKTSETLDDGVYNFKINSNRYPDTDRTVSLGINEETTFVAGADGSTMSGSGGSFTIEEEDDGESVTYYEVIYGIAINESNYDELKSKYSKIECPFIDSSDNNVWEEMEANYFKKDFEEHIVAINDDLKIFKMQFVDELKSGKRQSFAVADWNSGYTGRGYIFSDYESEGYSTHGVADRYIIVHNEKKTDEDNVVIRGKKEVINQPEGQSLYGFEFQAYEIQDTYDDSYYNGGEPDFKFINDGDGNISFNFPISASNLGTRYYVIRENPAHYSGGLRFIFPTGEDDSAYDGKYFVRIDTSWSENKESLNTQVFVKNSSENEWKSLDELEEPLLFVNEIRDPRGYAKIEGTKKMRNLPPTFSIPNNMFSFVLMEDDKVIQTVRNSNRKIEFYSLPYSLQDVGTHTYTIKEVNNNLSGYIYDTHEEIVKVNVVNDGSGSLKTEVIYDEDGLVFTNGYSDTPATPKTSAKITGTKHLTGKELKDNDFTFELKEGDEVIGTVKNTGGNFTFNLEYEEEGTHTYTITEKNDGKDGIAYDTHAETVTVNVEKNDENELVATVQIDEDGVVFNNAYTATGSITLSGTKRMEGKAMGEYSFVLKEGDTEIATVKNNPDGTITFPEIEYDAEGEHTYTISEVNDNKPGITYDEHTERVTVNVTDNGDGTLKAEATYDEDGIVFTNVYNADGTVTISGNKELVGRDLKAGEFSFILNGEEETTIDENGNFSFAPIAYTLKDVGTHTYTIKEKNDGKAGISYDDSEKTVTVEVKDNGDGTLYAEIKSDPVKFTNRYNATGKATISGKKNCNKMDSFNFALKEGDEVKARAINDDQGNFSFTEIPYTLEDVGTHTYTVNEENNQKPGITYDTHTETVTVDVKDNGDGTLSTEVKTDADGVTFNNTYSATGDYQIKGKKILSGKPMDNFSFTLKKGDTVIETVQNDNNGDFSFSNLEFTLNDVGTHTYTIIEENDNKGGVSYDNHVETITLKVSDAGDGQLTVEPQIDADGIVFNNSYSSSGSVAISGDKILEGASLKDDTFSFELRENGELIETVKNKGGKVNFSPLVYSIEDAGIHTYTVTEKQEGMAGITYDTHTAEVKVEVTDNGDGTLRAEMLTDNFTFNNSFAKEVNISKTDLGGNELEGAHIVVTGDDFKEEWDSTKEPHKLTLAEGTYTLQETVAPVGYDKITTTVEFEVKADATVKLNTTTVDNVETDGNGNIVLKNNAKKHNVKINKTDLNGAEIENATIKVTGTDLEGNSVNEEWVSKKNETFDLELKAGNYTFEEVSAPVGYVKVDTKVDFTVEKDGTVNISNTEVAPAGAVEYKDGIIILKDKIKEYDINISKTDLGGEEVEGAQISVYENDKKIDSWTSSKEAHTITLAPGTYVMKEEVAPAGFKKITTNIQFEVALDGSVSLITTSVENGKVEIKEDGTIILMDEPEEPPTEPVEEPSEPKEEPTEPVEEPTEEPTQPVEKPTETPIETPTEQPTEPVEEPTETPTEPVIEPTEEPIETPIEEPIIEQIEPIIEPIIEEEVPETGDTNLLPLWIALMAVSAVTLTGVIVKRRKNQ